MSDQPEKTMRCKATVWIGILDSRPCGKRAKYPIDNGVPVKSPLCGIHAQRFKKNGTPYTVIA